MITYYNRHHALHQGRVEMFRGELVPCFEVPARADQVLLELQRRKLGPVLDPLTFDDTLLARVHSPRYLAFWPAPGTNGWRWTPAMRSAMCCPRSGRLAVCAPTCCPTIFRRVWGCLRLTLAHR